MAEITIPVTIQTKEVLFDIKNKTHLVARSMKATGKVTPEMASHMQADEESDNKYEMMRAVSDALGNVRAELSEYLDGDSDATDNLIGEAVESGDAVVLNFKMPSNYNQSAVEVLGSSIHGYLVNSGLGAWYRYTDMKIADVYNRYAAEYLLRAKIALYRRERPERPQYAEENN